MLDVELLTAVQMAITTKAALKALDRASVKVLAFDQFVRLSDKAFEARNALASLLDQQHSDFALTGHTDQGQQIFFMPSSKQDGCWQLTRFDRQSEPWGDTHYTGRLAGIEEYLQKVDLQSLCCQDGALWRDELSAQARAALLQDTKAVSDKSSPLTLHHGT